MKNDILPDRIRSTMRSTVGRSEAKNRASESWRVAVRVETFQLLWPWSACIGYAGSTCHVSRLIVDFGLR
jgi:hypothetical protein